MFLQANCEKQLLEDDSDPGSSPQDISTTPGQRNGVPTFHVLSLEGLIGLEFAWKVALDASRPEVVKQAMALLLRVYIHGTSRLHQQGVQNAVDAFVRCVQSPCHSLRREYNACAKQTF